MASGQPVRTGSPGLLGHRTFTGGNRTMSKTIMTVDDSASMRQMISFTLTQAGHQVIEACDGRDALTKLGSASPDMLITDLNMPNMDGIELIRQARTLPKLKYT